jgi:thiol-disulfide isomerase/thioredoxin
MLLLIFVSLLPARAQNSSDAVAEALRQGDLYQSKHKYELALEAYHKADKAAHHTCAQCYLKISDVERRTGDFSSALDDTKHAIKAAGDNKKVAVEGYLARAALLAGMAGKPTDKKLKEAEEDIRQALGLDPGVAVSRFNLGMVLLKQERDPEGLAELNAFIHLPNADPADLADARRTIANPVRARTPFAPGFSFTTLENQQISNASIKGKVVLLDFWGTWCPPCRESVPILRSLNKRYSTKGFQLIGVSSDDDEDVWKTFVAAQKMDWSEYIDLSGKMQESFKIESFPTYIVVDKDGVIRFRQSGLGPSTEGELDEAIGKALKRDSDPKLAAAAAAETAPAHAPAEQHPVVQKVMVSRMAVETPPPPAGAAAEPRDFHPIEPVSAPGIEDWTVSGNAYKNRALGLKFDFPPDWVAAKQEVLKPINEQTAAGRKAIIQQHPELGNGGILAFPEIIFYASRKGAVDGRRIEIPSIRITALPARAPALTLDGFRQTVAQMAEAGSLEIFAAPAEYRVDGHAFFRADLTRATGARYFTSFVETQAGNDVLNIELFAYSADELDRLASSLQAISISEN